MKNKGFTLVELLVAISILAILTVISIPTLRAFQAKNSAAQYESYKKSMNTSGKLYIDSYSDDLFGQLPLGCEQVTIKDLIGKKLAKDISLKDISCNIDFRNSFVLIKKFNSEYQYASYLYCMNSKTVTYEDDMSAAVDCVNSDGNPEIFIESNNSTNINGSNQQGSDTNNSSKNKTVYIKLRDQYGFTADQEVDYVWTKSSTPPATFSKNYKYNNRYKKTNGNPVVLVSSAIANPGVSPSNAANEDWWIHVKPVKVQNIVNNSKTDIVTAGPFRFDHEAPKCNQITVSANVPNGGATRDLTLTMKYADALDDLSSYQIYVSYTGKNGSYELLRNVTGVSSATNKTITIPVDKTQNGKLKEGHVYVQIRNLKDAAGNVNTNTCQKDEHFYLDRTNPTCSFNLNGTYNSSSKWWKEKDVTVTLNTPTGDYGSPISSKGLNTTGTKDYNNTTTATQGDTASVTYHGYTKDAAGNEGECNNTFKVDKTKPTCTVTANGAITYDSTGTYTVTCTDQLSKISTKNLTNNDFTGDKITVTNVSGPTAVTNGFSYTVTAKATNGSGSGTLTIKANTFTDTAGNGNAAASGAATLNKKSIPIPTNTYCKTGLVYTGSSQTLTNTAGTGFTFSNNTATNAGAHNVTVSLSPAANYQWSDGTTVNKTIGCSIAKANTATTGSCNSGLTYNGSNKTLASGGSYVTYSNNTASSIGAHVVTVNSDNNHTFADGTTSKSLTCSITNPCIGTRTVEGWETTTSIPSSFRVWIQLYQVSGSSNIHWECWIQVTGGDFYNSFIQDSDFAATDGSCRLNGPGWYCGNSGETWGVYGQTRTVSCYATYIRGSTFETFGASASADYTPYEGC